MMVDNRVYDLCHCRSRILIYEINLGIMRELDNKGIAFRPLFVLNRSIK